MPRFHFRLPVVLVSLVLAAQTGCATMPQKQALPASPAFNLGDEKLELKRYIASGDYDRDVAALDAKVEAWIAQEAHQVARPAIVLDIDETSLSNMPEIKADDFGFLKTGSCHLPAGPCGHKAWQQMAAAPAIQPTLSIYRTAIANGVAVFFITGRDEKERAATAANLRHVGFTHWQELVLRPAGTTTPSAADYKAPQRARIEAMGYTIIANIGDQPSDLEGGHARRTFQVPNPFYRIP